MGAIFINYRREETAGEARALFNELVAMLGKGSVFMDVDNIGLGRDFREVLQERLASCDLMLSLIGKNWLNAKNASGERRVDEANDFVRLEIEVALKRNIPVTPVLVQGAQMPSANQLPAEIRDFAYRNGFELSHSRWASDVQEMVKRLGLTKDHPKTSEPESLRANNAPAQATVASQPAPAKKSRATLLISSLVAVIAALGFAYYQISGLRSARQVEIEKAKADAEARVAAAQADVEKTRAELEAANRARVESEAANKKLASIPERSQPRADPSASRTLKTNKAETPNQPSPRSETTPRPTSPANPTAPRPPESPSQPLPSSEDVASLLQRAEALARGSGVTLDLPEAARLYRKAAEVGNAKAQFALGNMYQTGRGVPKDEAEAMRWFRKAAAQANPDAQYNIGIAYSSGRGVPKDEAEAAKWYDKAITGFRGKAEHGDLQAAYLLGHMYLYGRGVSTDDQEALRWFRKAAHGGYAGGQYYLGLMHANGRGVTRDYSEAAKWYRKAADQGQVVSQYMLAELYANGRGVSKDEAEAIRWYQKAAERGFPDAQAALTRRGLTWSR